MLIITNIRTEELLGDDMIDTLFVGLSQTIETGDFKYLMSAYIGVLRNKGLNVDRLQIPMNKSAA